MEYLKKLYKTKSNDELLSIIENKEDYQEKAVIVAQEELASRNLSEEDIQNAHKVIEEKKLKEIENKKNRAKNISIYETPVVKLLILLNPFENEVPIYKKFIFYISLYFIFVPIYFIYQDLPLLKEFNFKPNDFTLFFVHFLPYLVYLTGGIFFLKEKKAGWYIVTGTIIFALGLTFLLTLKFGIDESNAGGWNLIAHIINGYFLVSIITASVILYPMFSKRVMEIYQIEKKDKMRTIIISSLITIYLYTKFVYN